MSLLLKIVGAGWALFGVGNIVNSVIERCLTDSSYLIDPLPIALLVFGLFFVFPGVAVFGIGVIVGRRKAARERRPRGNCQDRQ